MSYIVQNGKLVKKVSGFKQTGKMSFHAANHPGTANVNTGQWKMPIRNGIVSMSAHQEANKMLQNVISDPASHRVYTDDNDLRSLPFTDRSDGFFIAILPTRAHPTQPNTRGFLAGPDFEQDAKTIMDKFGGSKVALGDGLYMISSYCTWDRAQIHYKDIHRVFGFAVIGFSTPEHLQILAEDPEHYLVKEVA